MSGGTFQIYTRPSCVGLFAYGCVHGVFGCCKGVDNGDEIISFDSYSVSIGALHGWFVVVADLPVCNPLGCISSCRSCRICTPDKGRLRSQSQIQLHRVYCPRNNLHINRNYEQKTVCVSECVLCTWTRSIGPGFGNWTYLSRLRPYSVEVSLGRGCAHVDENVFRMA